MGMKHLTKWNREVIVQDLQALKLLIDVFSVLFQVSLTYLITNANRKSLIGFLDKIDLTLIVFKIKREE